MARRDGAAIQVCAFALVADEWVYRSITSRRRREWPPIGRGSAESSSDQRPMRVTTLVCFADVYARAQIRQVLEGQGIAVVAEVGGQQSAAVQIVRGHTAVATVEASLIAQPERTLLSACSAHSVAIVAVIRPLDRLDPADLLHRGVLGLVPADGPSEELVHAVAAAAAGAVYVSAPFTKGVTDVVSRRLAETSRWAALKTLTPRERDVLHHVVEGRSNAQVARELSISIGTVRFHVSNILSKLGRTSRAELIVLVMQSRSRN